MLFPVRHEVVSELETFKKLLKTIFFVGANDRHGPSTHIGRYTKYNYIRPWVIGFWFYELGFGLRLTINCKFAIFFLWSTIGQQYIGYTTMVTL